VIKNYIITGDTHGVFTDRLIQIREAGYWGKEDETAIIVLGDAGVDYYLDGRDKKLKKELQESGFTFYLLRGNHEARPSNIPGMVQEYDGEVNNIVWVHPDYPAIRYFIDGELYLIKNHLVLTIGGAYSVDKYYRLSKGWRWFENEQLSPEEREKIAAKVANLSVDFVFTHTCPAQYEPRDLFLPMVDQSTVDKSMEFWFDEIMDTFDWHIWLWGHYHQDRLERPHMEMLFRRFYEIDEIHERHRDLDYRYMLKSPNFYINDCCYGYRLLQQKGVK